MIDTSTINMLEIVSRYTSMKKTSQYKGGQYNGVCPSCGGEDRFHVFVGTNSFWCRGCGVAGDPLTFISWTENLDLSKRDDLLTACWMIGINLEDNQQPSQQQTSPRYEQPPVHLTERRDYLCFHPHWQERSEAFLDYATGQLWNNKRAIEYLLNRGISQSAIAAARIGFNPKDWRDVWANQSVWLPRGIVIPWMIDESIYTPDNKERWHQRVWRIRFRRLDDRYKQVDKLPNGNELKYPQVKGSANAIYTCGHSSIIKPHHTIILMEGEFDAISLISSVPEALLLGIKAIATGGVTNARDMRWIAGLSMARQVFLAFDDDKAGADASLWWAAVLNDPVKVKRLKPTKHDVNDMVTSGENLYQWLGIHHPSPPAQQNLFSEQPNPYGAA